MFYLLATVLFSLVVALFAMQNAASVTVSLAVWHVEASLALVVIGSAALGILAAMPIWLMLQIKLRLRLGKVNGRVKELELELANIRKKSAESVAKPTADKSEKLPEAKKEA